MEPLEKATVTAVLFADPAPAKTAVCLHRQDRKERWVLPPRQPAVRPGARDPGPRTVCKLQVLQTGYWHGCLQTHTHLRVLLLERSGEMCEICRPQVQLPDGRAGPRHLIDMKPHLILKLGWKEPGGIIPWGPHAFKNFKDLPICLHSLRLELSCVPRG